MFVYKYGYVNEGISLSRRNHSGIRVSWNKTTLGCFAPSRGLIFTKLLALMVSSIHNQHLMSEDPWNRNDWPSLAPQMTHLNQWMMRIFWNLSCSFLLRASARISNIDLNDSHETKWQSKTGGSFIRLGLLRRAGLRHENNTRVGKITLAPDI